MKKKYWLGLGILGAIASAFSFRRVRNTITKIRHGQMIRSLGKVDLTERTRMREVSEDLRQRREGLD